MKRAIVLLISSLFSLNICLAQVRNIAVSYDDEVGELDSFTLNCIGAGRAHEGLRAEWQRQLAEVQKEVGFNYIRFHGILHDDMAVYSEDKTGNPIFNWQYVDELYDFLLSVDVKPFVELSFMPKALASGEEEVFWWKGNITPPNSYEKYEQLIANFASHLKDRYGEDEVSTWYFEVWNEANHHLFFAGEQEDYFKMYEMAAAAIKNVSPLFRVGGPATAGTGWVQDFLKFCSDEKLPLDFISTHNYGVKGFFDSDGERYLKLRPDPMHISNNVKMVRSWINESEFKGLELHFTEWGSSYSPLDPIHDTYQNATYVLNVLKNTEGAAQSMSYWVFTDIFEELGVPKTPFHGGFGLINLQGIKKPTYQVYKYLNMLGPTKLKNEDKDSWITRTEGGVQALIWDFTFPQQGEDDNKTYFTKLHPSKEKPEVRLEISDLPDGVYQMEIFKTGYANDDVFSAYYLMGMPRQLSVAQEEHLRKLGENAPDLYELVEVKNGKFTKGFSLAANDIVFIELKKI